MESVMDCDTEISGKYKHFKGNFYDVYCVACGDRGEKYVLYQQCYGDKSFWIRPYEMFFQTVTLDDGSITRRFNKTTKTKPKTINRIKKLIDLIINQELTIHHSESEEEYIITNISEEQSYVIVYPMGYNPSGYLTDYELMYRLGFNSCNINGDAKYFKCKKKLDSTYMLIIGKNNIDCLSHQINPCSIDLQIADSGYLCAKRKLVDPQSVVTISEAEELWKPVHLYKSKRDPDGYIKLRPGKTILTHTKEKIKIPRDCAAKIEIKSTFARLSLDITSGDFCNPGYHGHYPLEITNRGKHTIIIHKGETMAQLMLIPLHGPILEDYTEKATYKNENKYDDGTPYTFWRERSIKALRKKAGTQQIVDLYEKALNAFTAENTKDINASRDRFNNNFLPFCQKNLRKAKYQDNNSDLPDEKKLLKAYCEKEKRLKALFSFKWVSGLLTIISAVCSFCSFKFQVTSPWIMGAVTIFFFILTVFMITRSPKIFCTFEKIDIEEILTKK